MSCLATYMVEEQMMAIKPSNEPAVSQLFIAKDDTYQQVQALPF